MTYKYSLQGIFTTMIGFVTWSPSVLSFFIRWPSDKANHSCENFLYVIQVKGFMALLDNYYSFWSLITIVASDCIGLALFCSQAVFV